MRSIHLPANPGIAYHGQRPVYDFEGLAASIGSKEVVLVHRDLETGVEGADLLQELATGGLGAGHRPR
jgi:hypothetical protein